MAAIAEQAAVDPPASPKPVDTTAEGIHASDFELSPGALSPTSHSFDEEEEHEETVKPWDEGGSSDCGYSDTVHRTLMSVGKSVHRVTGDPSQKLNKMQTSIGNWFQELSYATRDLLRGGEHANEMHKDTADAVKELISGGAKEEQQEAPKEPEEEEDKKEDE